MSTATITTYYLLIPQISEEYHPISSHSLEEAISEAEASMEEMIHVTPNSSTETTRVTYELLLPDMDSDMENIYNGFVTIHPATPSCRTVSGEHYWVVNSEHHDEIHNSTVVVSHCVECSLELTTTEEYRDDTGTYKHFRFN